MTVVVPYAYIRSKNHVAPDIHPRSHGNHNPEPERGMVANVQNAFVSDVDQLEIGDTVDGAVVANIDFKPLRDVWYPFQKAQILAYVIAPGSEHGLIVEKPFKVTPTLMPELSLMV
jgi:hypothetical protein